MARASAVALRLLRRLYGLLSDSAKTTAARIPPLAMAFQLFAALALEEEDGVCRGSLGGCALYAPLDFAGFFLLGEYEPVATQAYCDSIKEGDVVVDVGGYIGLYSLLAARRVGTEGQVICFEPDPTNFNLIEKNIIANGCPNVRAVNSAVSERTGRGLLYQRDSSTHTLVEGLGGGGTSHAISCELVSLDEYTRANGIDPSEIHVVKIDAEGSEMQILKGMSTILNSAQRLTIICELNPSLLKAGGTNPEQLVGFLKTLGFDIRIAGDRGPGDIDRKIEMIGAGSGVNLICQRT